MFSAGPMYSRIEWQVSVFVAANDRKPCCFPI